MNLTKRYAAIIAILIATGLVNIASLSTKNGSTPQISPPDSNKTNLTILSYSLSQNSTPNRQVWENNNVNFNQDIPQLLRELPQLTTHIEHLTIDIPNQSIVITTATHDH